MGQAVQIIGSLLVLTAFAAAQRGRLDAKSGVYLGLNIAGSLILAVEAVLTRQWGFLLLEAVWAVVSSASLLSRLRGQGPIECARPRFAFRSSAGS